MKVLIDIPEEFVLDYSTDRFAEFFQRCCADMSVLCGNYELETAEMMKKAFSESRIYDLDKVVEQLEAEQEFWNHSYDKKIGKEKARSYAHAIEIVETGGNADLLMDMDRAKSKSGERIPYDGKWK